jgi:hypothetical protein
MVTSKKYFPIAVTASCNAVVDMMNTDADYYLNGLQMVQVQGRIPNIVICRRFDFCFFLRDCELCQSIKDTKPQL